VTLNYISTKKSNVSPHSTQSILRLIITPPSLTAFIGAMIVAFSLRQYLLFSFGLVLMFFTESSIYVTYEVQKIHVIEENFINNRLPAVIAGEKLLDGIDLSLAGLRAYRILGKDSNKAEKFKVERAAGCEKTGHVLVSYEELSSIWVDTKILNVSVTLKHSSKHFV
jgi:hypothetical protein